MADFAFLTREVVLAIHEEQLAQHGGGIGVRDEGLLGSALARPVNHALYDEAADLAAIAADYAFGIAKNHPFVDGNKRTAFVAMELCLELNGGRLDADDEQALMAMLELAAGEQTVDAFAAWIRSRLAQDRADIRSEQGS